MAYIRRRPYRGRSYRSHLRRRRALRRGRRLIPYRVPRPLSRKYGTTFLRFSISETRAVGNNGAGWYSMVPGPYTLRAAWTGKYNYSGTAPRYPWDYYRILKVRVEVWPTYNFYQLPGTLGSSVIDLDSRIAESTTTRMDTDPFRDRSSRKTWNPRRKHSRYYTPKPDLISMSGVQGGPSRVFQPNARNMWWLNCEDDLTSFFGPGFSLYSDATTTYRFNIRTVFYIQFKEFLAPVLPTATSDETGETESLENIEI